MKTPPAAIALLLISEAALCGSWSYIGGAYPHAAFIESTTILDEGPKGFGLQWLTWTSRFPLTLWLTMFKWTAASGNLGLCKAIFTYEASVWGAM